MKDFIFSDNKLKVSFSNDFFGISLIIIILSSLKYYCEDYYRLISKCWSQIVPKGYSQTPTKPWSFLIQWLSASSMTLLGLQNICKLRTSGQWSCFCRHTLNLFLSGVLPGRRNLWCVNPTAWVVSNLAMTSPFHRAARALLQFPPISAGICL